MKYLKNFQELIEESKIFYDDVQPFEEEVQWQLILNISPMWKQYQNHDVSLEKFNQYYAQFLEDNQQNINKLNGWEEMKPIIEKLKTSKEESESHKIYDRLYDIADKYLIKIQAE